MTPKPNSFKYFFKLVNIYPDHEDRVQMPVSERREMAPLWTLQTSNRHGEVLKKILPINLNIPTIKSHPRRSR